MKIVADSHIPFIKHYFKSYGELILKPGREITARDVKDADLLLVRSITPVNAELLSESAVKFVGSVTAGSDHLDIQWLDGNNIAWALATAFNAPPVADYVVSIVAAMERLKLLGEKRKAAVVGVGNVGKLVVKRLQLLQFDVVQCDPFRAESEQDFISIPLQELTDLDLISLHVPLSKTGSHPTYHFIGKEFLQKQKPGCLLLNASRGAIIDENILMLHGTHLQWCFDVWEHEPKINLAILKKAILATPHIAGYSVQSKLRGIDMIYRIACEKKIIIPKLSSTMSVPSQKLSFAANYHHWQDVVLGVFNPIIMTAMMREKLLSNNTNKHAFDEMRNQFNYRHEFSYTYLANMLLNLEDETLLKALGFHFNS